MVDYKSQVGELIGQYREKIWDFLPGPFRAAAAYVVEGRRMKETKKIYRRERKRAKRDLPEETNMA